MCLIVLFLMSLVLFAVVLELALLAGDDAVGPHKAGLELFEIMKVELTDFFVIADGVLGIEAEPKGVG